MWQTDESLQNFGMHELFARVVRVGRHEYIPAREVFNLSRNESRLKVIILEKLLLNNRSLIKFCDRVTPFAP